MNKKKTDFIVQAAILDKYIHLEAPSMDNPAIKAVVNELKRNNDLKRYFFGHNPSPGWAKVLYQNGFFENSPDIVLVEQGYQTPYWDVSSYLLAVASDVPDTVFNVVNEIETNNPVIHEHLIKALCKIPAIHTANLIDKVKHWLQNEYANFWGGAEGASDLISHLIENGFIAQGLEILDELLTPIPTPVGKSGDYSFGGEAKPRQELDHLQPDFWHERLPQFEKKAFPQVIQILESKLLDAIRLEAISQNKSVDFASWESSIWRASIGDSNQDLGNSYKDSVVVALRNALDSRSEFQSEEIRPFLDQYLTESIVILRRLALFICAKHPTIYLDLAKNELTLTEIHNDLRIHNEYFLLLNKVFPHLSANDKARVIEIILEGPEQELTEAKKEFAAQSNLSLEDYLGRRKDLWIRDRLLMIRDHLIGENQAILEALVANYGRPDHPEFLFWSSGGFWIKDVSPLSKDDLSRMSVDEVVKFVKSWQHDPSQEFGPENISMRGLGEALADFILDEPPNFEELILQLDDLPPLVAAILFNKAEERSKTEKLIPWLYLLRLAYRCTEKEYLQTHTEDNTEARLEAIRLIRHGLSSRTGGELIIPRSHLDDVEKIIKLYLDDSNPNLEQDRPPKGYFGHKDPITVSLNTVRPISFVCFMELLRFRLTNLPSYAAKSDLLTDEIKKILDEKLDITNENSLAVHSIFGQYFWLLSNISMEWIQGNRFRIFPLGGRGDSEDYFSSSWDSYLLHNQPSILTIELLRNEYIAGIDLLKRRDIDTPLLNLQNRLFLHIFMHYLWTSYDLSDSKTLMNLLFTRSDASTRGSAINTICKIVNDHINDKEFDRKWPLIKKVWQWRVNEVSLSSYPEEFREEIEALSALPKVAPKTEKIREMGSLLRYFIIYVDEYRVWKNLEEFLANRVEDEPAQVAKYYLEMHKNLGKHKSGFYPRYDKSADKILTIAIKDNRSRRDTLEIIDSMSRKGNQKYRSLYEQYT